MTFYYPLFEKACSNKLVLLPMVFLKELFRAEKLWLAAEVGFDVYEGQGSQEVSEFFKQSL